MNMSRIVSFLALFFLIQGSAKSQVMPAENTELNYRLVGFSIPSIQQTDNFTFEIANGNYDSEDAFKKNIIKTIDSKTNKVLAEVPHFGGRYTWRVVSGKSKTEKSALYHFSTGSIPEVDVNNTRLSILQQHVEHKSGYVFVDGDRVLYNMKGEPIWFLPSRKEYGDVPMDLKLSPLGTITFIMGKRSFEVNYSGDILWQGPDNNDTSGGIAEMYHHEFSRLANGNYMVLGLENAFVLKHPAAGGDKVLIVSGSKMQSVQTDTSYRMNQFGTIIEYDPAGKVVWSWRSIDYFKESDVLNRVAADGTFDLNMHENAFFFDEHEHAIYVSFKTCSRILKVAYPAGNVLNAYGEVYKPGVPEMKNGLFYGQHACKRSQKGYLYLFNNNMRDEASMPEIVVMEEPRSRNDTLKKIWQYSCTMEGISDRKLPGAFQTGGNVVELADESFFVSMSIPFSKMFIVNKDKKIVWSAISEKWSEDAKKWRISPHYRASMVSNPADIERLVWNSEGAGGLYHTENVLSSQ